MQDTGIPDMMARILHEQNRKGALFSFGLGLFGPLTALLMMHYGGQGSWDNMSLLGWTGRFVALCCLTVSAPKVYRFFLKATGGQRVEALGATGAVEIAALLAVSHVVGLYAFLLQVVINTLVYSNSISMDQKAIHRAEREDRQLTETPVPGTLSVESTKQVPVVTKAEAKVLPIKRVRKDSQRKRAVAPKAPTNTRRKNVRNA